MTSVLTRPRPDVPGRADTPTPSRAGRIIGTAAGFAVVAAVGIFFGIATATGADKIVLVLPLAAVAAVALGVLAITNFEVFVLVVLVVRSTLDALKISSGGTSALNPASLLSFAFLMASFVWLAARRADRGPHRASTLQWVLGAYLTTATLSAIGSIALGQSIIDLSRIFSAVMMFFVLDRLIETTAQMRRVVYAVVLSAVLPALVGLAGAAGLVDVFESKGEFARLTSTFGQSNGFGRYLMIVLVMALAIRRHPRGTWSVAHYALLLVGGYCLLLTYTRSAWIATLIGVVVVGRLVDRRVLGALAVGALLLVPLAPSVVGRFSDLGTTEVDVESNTEEANSLLWRVSYWQEVLPLANDNPVTGIGLAATGTQTDEGKLPHNDFVRAYVETGLLGLLAYLAFMVTMARTTKRALDRARPGFERHAAAGIRAVFWAFVMVSAVANVMSQVVFLWYLFALAAVANFIALRERPMDDHGTVVAPADDDTRVPIRTRPGPDLERS